MTTSAIIALIISTANTQGVDPMLALAVAKVESGYRTGAIGTHGEIGLFQLMPYHAKGENLYDPKTNIRLGIRYLRRVLRDCEDLREFAVLCFNQGPAKRPKHPEQHPYYKKIVIAQHT